MKNKLNKYIINIINIIYLFFFRLWCFLLDKKVNKIKIISEFCYLDKYVGFFYNIYYYKKNTNILHNPYGPAYIGMNGYEAYYIEDELHRLDGPARIWPDGNVSYFINGENLSKEEFEIHPERLKFLGKEHLICLK